MVTACRVTAQGPCGRVVLTGTTKVKDPVELARFCRSLHLQPSVLEGCPDALQRVVRLHL